MRANTIALTTLTLTGYSATLPTKLRKGLWVRKLMSLYVGCCCCSLTVLGKKEFPQQSPSARAPKCLTAVMTSRTGDRHEKPRRRNGNPARRHPAQESHGPAAVHGAPKRPSPTEPAALHWATLPPSRSLCTQIRPPRAGPSRLPVWVPGTGIPHCTWALEMGPDQGPIAIGCRLKLSGTWVQVPANKAQYSLGFQDGYELRVNKRRIWSESGIT